MVDGTKVQNLLIVVKVMLLTEIKLPITLSTSAHHSIFHPTHRNYSMALILIHTGSTAQVQRQPSQLIDQYREGFPVINTQIGLEHFSRFPAIPPLYDPKSVLAGYLLMQRVNLPKRLMVMI